MPHTGIQQQTIPVLSIHTSTWNTSSTFSIWPLRNFPLTSNIHTSMDEIVRTTLWYLVREKMIHVWEIICITNMHKCCSHLHTLTKGGYLWSHIPIVYRTLQKKWNQVHKHIVHKVSRMKGVSNHWTGIWNGTMEWKWNEWVNISSCCWLV